MLRNLNKVVNFFIEIPEGKEFELVNSCKVNPQNGVYSFLKDRFDYEVSQRPIKGSFAYKEVDENGEEIWHCFIPFEEGYIPVFPFAVAFKDTLSVEVGTLDNVFVFISQDLIPNCLLESEEDVFVIQIGSERNVFERIKVFSMSLYNALYQFSYAGGNKHWVYPKSLEGKIKELLKELNVKNFSGEAVENPLWYIIEYGRSGVRIPKNLKIKNIALVLFVSALIFTGYKGWQKYKQYRLEQERAKHKVWTPTLTFKKTHMGYYFDAERDKFKKVADLLKPSEIKIKNLSFDKRGYAVLYVSPFPVFDFSRRGNYYAKTEVKNFRQFRGWKAFKNAKPKPLPAFKEVYEKFRKAFGKGNFKIVSYSNKNVEGIGLKCVEIREHDSLSLLDTKALLESLAEFPVMLKNGKISQATAKIGGEKYNSDIRFFLCGSD
jgi:hypothetical protein